MRKQKLKLLYRSNKWKNKKDMVEWIMKNKNIVTNKEIQIHKNKKTNVTVYSQDSISMLSGKHKLCNSLHGPGMKNISWSTPHPFY